MLWKNKNRRQKTKKKKIRKKERKYNKSGRKIRRSIRKKKKKVRLLNDRDKESFVVWPDIVPPSFISTSSI